jgi:hypothetical protein
MRQEFAGVKDLRYSIGGIFIGRIFVKGLRVNGADLQGFP